MDEEPKLSDLDTRSTDAPKPKRKWARRKPRRQEEVLAAVEQSSPFEGLSPHTCCTSCRQGRCVITHDEICGHPGQGLQPTHALIPAVVERRRAATQYLAMKKAEKKYA